MAAGMNEKAGRQRWLNLRPHSKDLQAVLPKEEETFIMEQDWGGNRLKS